MTRNPSALRTTILTVSLVFLAAGTILACQVPVFRYALERWAPGQFRIYVLTPGESSAADRTIIASLAEGNEKMACVEVHSIGESVDAETLRLWQKYGNRGKAVIVGLYPEHSEVPDNTAAFALNFSQEAADGILRSPAREELVKRLADGHSAVWLFVKSGHEEGDKAALKRLQDQLDLDSEELRLPDQEALNSVNSGNPRIRLGIQFSVIEISRDDPREHCLIETLLNSDEELRTFDEPMSFPVFGRGRVLYGIVGEGMTAENIRTASEFIVGPCSCLVKEQNPGFDLPLACNWDELVGDVMISEPMPEKKSRPELLVIPPGKAKP